MDDESRKTEILQAEQAIRSLAEEMARARDAADAAEELHARLAEALATLAAARDDLAAAVEAQGNLTDTTRQVVGETVEQARSTLADAAEGLQTSLGELRQATDLARAAAEKVDGALGKLAGRLDTLGQEVGETSVSVNALDRRLGDAAAVLQSVAVSVAEIGQDARNAPLEVTGRVRKALRGQKAWTVVAVLLSTACLVGVGMIIWLLLEGPLAR